MKSIIDLLKIEDSDIRSKALQALMIIISENYQYMKGYLNDFF